MSLFFKRLVFIKIALAWVLLSSPFLEGGLREAAILGFYKSGTDHLSKNEIESAIESVKAIGEIDAAHPVKHQLISEIRLKISVPKQNIPKIIKQASTIGTAWPLSSGYVITNNHVVADCKEVVLIDTSGDTLTAKTAFRDKVNDIALLKVEEVQKLPPALPLASEKTTPGSKVFTLGFPRIDVWGISPKYSEGIIHRLAGINGNPAVYQTTVPIEPGNSGGPLLNMKGEVVGVMRARIGYRYKNQAIVDYSESASLAIKISRVKDFFGRLPQSKAILDTLPCQVESVENHFNRLRHSMLIVIAQ